MESKEKKIKEIQAADAKRMAAERGRGRGRGGGQRGGHYDAGRGRRGDNVCIFLLITCLRNMPKNICPTI